MHSAPTGQRRIERKAIIDSLADRGISFEHLAEVTEHPGRPIPLIFSATLPPICTDPDPEENGLIR